MTKAAPPVRSLTLPDGHTAWLLRGPPLDVPASGLWPMIAASLETDRSRERVASGTHRLTGGETLDLLALFADIPRGRRVGVHVARSVPMVLAVLAVWRAGSTYVPLPTDLPEARIALMVEGCRPDAIITDQAGAHDGYECQAAITVAGRPLFVMLRTLDDPDLLCAPGPVPSYIAHTSGTSGTPKAVLVSEAALLNRLMSLQRLVCPVAADRVLFKTSLAFDVHVWEFALPLISGCRLVIYDQERFFDLRNVARLLDAERITIAGFVPSLLGALLDRPDFTSASALRLLFCGGEAWGSALARRFHERLRSCVLRNSYGPAETTLAVANWLVPPGATRIEIGAPLDNLLFLIEPRTGAAGGKEIGGMLSIGGAQVADGYVGVPADDRFATIPIDGQMTRFYRTGDDVSLDLETGTLSFKGRHDQQVKLNGVRIELGEIEAVIRSVPEVEACAVVLLTGASRPCLIATYKTAGGQFLDPARVRKRCAELLPSTHVPGYFREIDSYTLNANGKIDRSRIEEILERHD